MIAGSGLTPVWHTNAAFVKDPNYGNALLSVTGLMRQPQLESIYSPGGFLEHLRNSVLGLARAPHIA